LKYIVLFGGDYSRNLINNLKEYYIESFNYLLDSSSLLFEALEYNEPRGHDVILILTNDHGDEFGEHGAIGHEGLQQKFYSIFHLYNELIHVPMIIAGPEIPFKRDVFELTSHLDRTPTIMDLAGPNTSNKSKVSRYMNRWFFGRSLAPYYVFKST